MDKYLNEAIIGNGNMLATYTQKGELQRLYYSIKDNKQYINYFHTGMKINDSNLINLHDDINNNYKQFYEIDTNILNTEIINTYFNIKVLQTDFVPIKENVLIKKYTFVNENSIDLELKFFIHSDIIYDQNNFVSCKMLDDGMIQYSHDIMVTTIAKDKKLYSYQIHNSKKNIKTGIIQDKDYIGMAHDSSIEYDLGILKPTEKKTITICVIAQNTPDCMQEFEKEITRFKKIDLHDAYVKTKNYWRKYVKTHDSLNLGEPKNGYETKIQEIYYRSILLFPLLTNLETGGIIAAPEVDEDFKYSGRYGYCWPRDAVYVTRAMDILKMNKEVERFYKIFCKKTQSKNGMWEQRFHADGRLAPCWGDQIDETASIIYGVYNHYLYCNDFKFLKNVLPMCEKGIEYLKKYIYDVIEEKGEFHLSYDLWENCESVHLYSLACIYGAFDSMLKIYNILGKNVSNFENNRLKDEKIVKSKIEIEDLQIKIKTYINDKLYDDKQKCYLRNIKDKYLDISLLGVVIPFNLFSPKEKAVVNTVEKINMCLRTYTGGYLRFENDGYRNGNNPWVIANAWLTLYYLEIGENRKAKETFDFIIKTAGPHNFLGEQIDNKTLEPNWVLGLGWSHAMFILIIEKMMKKTKKGM